MERRRKSPKPPDPSFGLRSVQFFDNVSFDYFLHKLRKVIRRLWDVASRHQDRHIQNVPVVLIGIENNSNSPDMVTSIEVRQDASLVESLLSDVECIVEQLMRLSSTGATGAVLAQVVSCKREISTLKSLLLRKGTIIVEDCWFVAIGFTNHAIFLKNFAPEIMRSVTGLKNNEIEIMESIGHVMESLTGMRRSLENLRENCIEKRSTMNLTENEVDMVTSLVNLTENEVDMVTSLVNLTEKDNDMVTSLVNLTENYTDMVTSLVNLTENGINMVTSLVNLTENEVDMVTSLENLKENKTEMVRRVITLKERKIVMMKSMIKLKENETELIRGALNSEGDETEMAKGVLCLKDEDLETVRCRGSKDEDFRMLDPFSPVLERLSAKKSERCTVKGIREESRGIEEESVQKVLYDIKGCCQSLRLCLEEKSAELQWPEVCIISCPRLYIGEVNRVIFECEERAVQNVSQMQEPTDTATI